MLKKIVLSAVLCASVCVLAGCGPKTPPPAPHNARVVHQSGHSSKLGRHVR